MDYFWVNSFGGTWNEQFSWKDAAGNTGIPGAGDNAYLVLPYQLANCFGGTCMTQPVPVTYRSATNPPLNRLVINSDNYLTQPAFGTPGQLDLTSNYQVIGSGESFTPPPGVFFPNPPGIYPRGLHLQYDGTNTVKTELVIGSVQMTFDTVPANAIEGGYRLDGGTLTVGDPVLGGTGIERIGRAGDGAFSQTGGTHVVHGTLIMAEQAGSSGTLDLRGGSLQAGGQVIGSAGRAEVQHVGGSNSVRTFIVGLSAGGEGTYQLSSGGTFSIGGDAVIGAAGKGTFQNSSNNSIAISGNLTVGRDAGSQGSFATTAGLTVGGNLIIGEAGTGTFSQGAGSSVSIGGDLRVGRTPTEGASGSYSLRNGTLAVSGRAVFGAFPANPPGPPASGSFDQSGGSLVVQSDLDLLNGNYPLSDGGQLQVVGENLSGPGAPTISIGSGGTFEQIGGIVIVGDVNKRFSPYTLSILKDGIYRVHSDDSNSLVIRGNLDVNGTFGQSGGQVDVGVDRDPNFVESNASVTIGANGVMALGGGRLKVSPVVFYLGSTPAAREGVIILNGRIEQSGSSRVEAARLSISGEYSLAGGVLQLIPVDLSPAPGTSGPNFLLGQTFIGGAGTFTHQGGEHRARYAEVLDGGRYQLAGGLLHIEGSESVPGDPIYPGVSIPAVSLVNRGNFDWSSGDVTLRGGDGSLGVFLNSPAAGSISTPKIAVSGGGTRRLDGNLYNWGGTVELQNTVLHVVGDYIASGIETVTGSGGVISDPSTLLIAGDAKLEGSAFFVGDAGSVFQMGADFINRSVNKADWNTAEATLLFDGEGAVAHAFYLPGMDRGASEGGFVDNFAWGVLGLAADDSLVLLDGNDAPGAALYVGVIAEGTDLDSISSPYNIYYNPALAGNSWLAGARMALDGGGFLAPVPEPRSALLLGMGVLMLAGLRRRWRIH